MEKCNIRPRTEEEKKAIVEAKEIAKHIRELKQNEEFKEVQPRRRFGQNQKNFQGRYFSNVKK